LISERSNPSRSTAVASARSDWRSGLAVPSDETLEFGHPAGEPLSPGGIGQQFAVRVRNAGLPPLPLHGLRHTHASLGLAGGIAAKVMQERLGHSSVNVTIDLYSHVIPELQASAAKIVADFVFGDATDSSTTSG